MQISPIPTLSEEINDIRLRTADIVANRIIPNEATIYAGGDKSKKLRKEINEEVKKLSQIKHFVVREAILNYLKNTNLEIHYDGDLPSRSGMGSSSSFVVGLLNTMHLFKNKRLKKRQIAIQSLNFEQEIEEALDKLADHVEQHVDIDAFISIAR